MSKNQKLAAAYENLFLRIAIMLLVDRTFIEVYEQYETCLKNT